jgi:hypothetical protein
MADTKISALPASTTPLAGTEVLPIVQSSTTKQVSVANLTAGRSVSALSVIIANDPSSIWGIDFGSSGTPSNLVSIANLATYDLASGSGVVYLWENGGNGVGVFYMYYGSVNINFQSAALYTNIGGTPLKVNVFFNGGTSKYRIENNSGGTLQFYISTIRLRNSV